MRHAIALVCVPMMVLSGWNSPVFAAKPKPFAPPAAQKIKPVPTRDVPLLGGVRGGALAQADRRAAPVWPAAGSAEIALPSGKAVQLGLESSSVRPPGLAVAVSPSVGGPARAKVKVFGRGEAKAAGIDGVLARVDSADGTGKGSTVGVSIDYSGFATAYGADWSSRLRLVSLPECALTTPGRPECASKPLVSKNDVSAKTVSAVVPVGGLVATMAAAAGGSGDYSATKLQASSTWSAGSNTGGFNWTYPMRTPPSVGGPAPSVSLSYSSQSVDGQMAANNNQPGWAGTGFELAPGGSIERSYKGCADDMTGGNNSVKTGDLCWATDNAILSLAGHSGELIYNSTENRWHLRGDDGSRVERRTSPSNGDNDNEYWVVTTTEGTQYWFGRNRLPGWQSGNPETKSTWTEPVFGNHAGEPCYAATFAASSCTQAWRWNLDYVIDMNGNTMSFWYETATNKYAKNQVTTSPVDYIRDGWLTKIEYGTRSSNDLATDPGQAASVDSIFAAAAPMEVEFTVLDRCLANCTNHDAVHWTDTPYDQECAGSPCPFMSPTFWSTKRLNQVITKIRDGAAYRIVETWTLSHTYPDPGDTTRRPLALSKLGHSGGAEAVPDVEFFYIQKNNRVVANPSEGRAPMNWFRLSQIKTETGATITVSYSPVDCVNSTKMPNVAALQDNTYRCYPVRWTPEGATQPILEFFHKYVVTAVREKDNTGGAPPFGSPEILTTYTYPTDGAAWHYTDDNGLTKEENRTYSVWRGYTSVTTNVGDQNQGDPLSSTVNTYFRGMHGDKLPTGTRTITIPAVDMNGDGDTADSVDAPAVNDEDDWAGQLRSSTIKNGPGGAEISTTVSKPWRSAATATRTLNGVTVDARHVAVEETRERVKLDHAPWWRTTSTRTEFDTYGMPIRVDDYGDDSLAIDNQCTASTYLRNTKPWLLSTVKENTKFALTCAQAVANPATLTEADVISNVRTSFDGQPWNTAPVKGMATQAATAVAWSAGTPTDQAVTTRSYDTHGRVIESIDALNHKTTTAYTPATGGPTTQTVTTDPMLFTTTKVIDPAFGLPTNITDTNGKSGDLLYDGMGRLTKVWLPGRDKLTETANLSFSYLVRNDGPVVVTSSRLNAVGGYSTTYALLDGLLRDRQTQAVSPSGGRILTDVFYDSADRKVRTFASYYDNRGGPGTTLVTPLDRHDVPEQNVTVYDGASRVTDVIFVPFDNGERWRTHSDYTGDRTDVTPPAGGTKTSTFTDARGNVTLLRQYDEPNLGDQVNTTYLYNRKNQLERITDHATNYWEYTYFLSGLSKTMRDPDAGTRSYQYDKLGQLTSETDALGQKLVYDYDDIGRKKGLYLTSKSTANKRATWTYDTALFSGTSTPAKGYLAESTRWTNAGTRAYKTTVVGYTANYQSAGTTITVPAAETGVAGSYTYLTSYRPDGSPGTSTYPATGGLPAEGVTLDYEPTTGMPFGLDTILGASEFSLVSSTAYNALAQVDQYTLYTGRYSLTGSKVWMSYQRQLETGRVTGISTSRETGTPSTLAGLAYTYDDAGNVKSIFDTAVGDNQCFKYDALRRLRDAWTPLTAVCGSPGSDTLGGPAPYRTRWELNTIGNRTQQVEYPTPAGGTLKTTNYTYPAAGADRPHSATGTTGSVVGTYKYDAAGNTTCRPVAAGNTCPTTGTTNSQIYTWDPEGHAATSTDSTGSTTYLYDADGNRILKTDPAGKTLYLPNQELRYTTSGGTQSCIRYYEFNGTTIASRNSTGLSWLSGDHHGTASIAIDSVTQAVVVRRQTPFGNDRGSTVSWPNSKGFVGGTIDKPGVTHLGAREYDVALGKFISVDPLFNKEDPQSMNNYGYADHSPTTLSDPSGTCIPDEDTGRCLSPRPRVNSGSSNSGGTGGGSATPSGSTLNTSGCKSDNCVSQKWNSGCSFSASLCLYDPTPTPSPCSVTVNGNGNSVSSDCPNVTINGNNNCVGTSCPAQPTSTSGDGTQGPPPDPTFWSDLGDVARGGTSFGVAGAAIGCVVGVEVGCLPGAGGGLLIGEAVGAVVVIGGIVYRDVWGDGVTNPVMPIVDDVQEWAIGKVEGLFDSIFGK
ncbi:RHS repeat-associated protein [Allocatelliglobosispora scoriae]|uniref:RHS repeat-associated protein n=1 Tax=Allocatelliglobosispora scoriae TaxID=643052 RepID=A0A841BSR4_9ACTN|nr:RHS repeat-associated core domain-containing protein [Allocatelliglobosispora scoriae]MBB5872117.1 RHS repeat-associated protein [Allocatelliglobosispora scoriae]